MAQKLLSWYDRHGRHLPWRKTRDPYRILVSEIMLQQTQVSRGLMFYDRWITQFPNWKSLAAASNADVIHAWAGLGYNRRALMLRDIARQMVEKSEKTLKYRVPKTEKEWMELKGIGPYTAAAICAFALKQRTLPIDTNIRRVGNRLLLGLPYPPHTTDDRRLRAAMDRFMPKTGRFYDVPQALFDLAVSSCTKIPSCTTCPLRNVCPAAVTFLSGRVRVPKAMIKKAVEKRHRNKPFPDRIYRGRILKAVREHAGSRPIRQIGSLIDPDYDSSLDADWLHNMIGRMEKDGMVSVTNNLVRLRE